MPEGMVRIAAAGDVHAREGMESQLSESFGSLRGKADMVLLAGDLTTCGDPKEARVLAEACAPLEIPVIAVLGNHDWHMDRADQISAVLSDAGVIVGVGGGVAAPLPRPRARGGGGRGGGGGGGGGGFFFGGFSGSHLPDF